MREEEERRGEGRGGNETNKKEGKEMMGDINTLESFGEGAKFVWRNIQPLNKVDSPFFRNMLEEMKPSLRWATLSLTLQRCAVRPF